MSCDLLQKAAANALRTFSKSFSSLKMEMEAGGFCGDVVITSSEDMVSDTATKEGAREVVRAIAKVSEFPSIAKMDPVTIGGAPRVITALKKLGGAMWKIGLSAQLNNVAASFTATCGGSRSTFSVPCLVSRGYDGVLEASPYDHRDHEIFIIVIRASDWPGDSAPDFGDIVHAQDFGRITVQQVSRKGGTWVAVGTSDERGEVV